VLFQPTTVIEGKIYSWDFISTQCC